MKIPKEIADKVSEYQIAQQKAENLRKEVIEWLNENTDTDAVVIKDIYMIDKPTGKLQNSDEYCDQTTLGEDWYIGTYYHQIEGSDKYIGYHYSC